jgi:hypothetical protein
MRIRTVDVREATGLLKKIYDASMTRAGRVASILRIMSPNPRVLQSSLRMYLELMMGESPLSRVQRELLATSVSVFNECEY